MSARDAGPAGPGRDGPDELLFARLHEELGNPPFHEMLRPVAERVESDGSVVVRLDYRPGLSGRKAHDFFNGGVIAALVDIAAHAAVAIQTAHMAPTIDLRVDYLRPAVGKSLYAAVKVLKLGRAVSRADVQIKNP